MRKKSQAAMERLLARFASKAGKIRARGISLHSIPRDCRGQAAMEFLLTYGWAILVVITAISALAYFGLLNPTQWFVMSSCHIEGGFSCVDHNVEVYNFLGDKNRINLFIINNAGYDYKFDSGKVIDGDFATSTLSSDKIIENNHAYDSNNDNNPDPVIIEAITKTGGGILQVGEKYSIEFEIKATNQETKLPYTFKGKVTGKVE